MKNLLNLLIALILFIIGLNTGVNAQGVGVNSSGNSADPSAVLDVSATNRGALIPRMTTAQRDAIVNPAEGLVIFNTDCKAFNYNAGTASAPIWAVMNSTTTILAGVAISANPSGAICEGTTVTFTASPAAGVTSASFQWKVNGLNVGTNSSTFATSTLNNGDVVSCELSSNAPCVTGSPATSNDITILVTPYPTVTSTTPASTCGAGAVTVGATSSTGVINWYDASTGGTLLSSGFSYTTPVISSNVTYYAEASAAGCTNTVRVAVSATVYTTSPAQPDPITGPTNYLGGISNVVYSISPVQDAFSYTWIVPSDAIIVNGQGTTSITVNFGCSAEGNITVVANNVCASSAPQDLYVSSSLNSPGSITGTTGICPNATETYSISPVPDVVYYNWTVPSDATINSGQGTTSISVTFGNTGGSLTVNSNGCSNYSNGITLNLGVGTFTYNPSTNIIGGTQVTFIPTSTFTGATYNWTFQGGTPSSSTAQYPVVTWPTQSSPTSFDVALSVSGCPAVTVSIIVSNSPGQAFVANGSGRTGSIQNFTVPSGVSSLTIRVYGAQGGRRTGSTSTSSIGGLGAFMSGVFSVSPSQVLNILVGQAGGNSISTSWAGGGGGGSFVVRSGTILIASGGGGGAGSNGISSGNSIHGVTSTTASNGSGSTGGTGGSGGNGGSGGTYLCNGGGYSTDGTSSTVGGKAYVNGGTGGAPASSGNGGDGGYGGGAGGGGTSSNTVGGGGGGGYSGGGGGGCCAPWPGGGGGSYNSGTSQSNTSGVNRGNGQVIITW